MNSLPKPETLVKASVAPIIALEDVIRVMHKRLQTAIRTRFSELTKNAADKHEVIVHFLAMLELVRSGSASASQDKLFSDITIELEQITLPQYGVSGI
jgi:chromatin segregation and condensation protein Rec8/ScpA/Scc1 (kleisin family)